MPSRTAAALVLMGWAACPAVADGTGAGRSTVLSSAQQVRNLSPEEAATSRPVRLTGVVTHANSLLNDFYLQDGTSGIYVHPTPLGTGLKPGDRVELEGVTDAGEFAPSVAARRIVPLGKGPLPDPMPFNLSYEDSRWLDGQWVQCWVIVRSVRTESQSTRLDVYTSQGAGLVVLPGTQWAAAARRLKDMAVTVRGVCAATLKDRMIAGHPRIYASSLDQVESMPADAGGAPDFSPRMIDHLLRFSPAPHPGARRVKIVGVVTAAPLPGFLVVQDDTAGAVVRTATARKDITVGTVVEAIGVLRIDGCRVTLTQAKVTVQHTTPLPAPLPISSSELAVGACGAVRVRLEGMVEGIRLLPGWTALALVDGAARFEVYAPGTPEQNDFHRLATGSRVAVVGVPLDVSPNGPGAGPNVYIPGGDAVTLLEPPPSPAVAGWWTASRVAWLSGGFLAVGLFGVGWLVLLRHQVQRAAGEVKQQFDEKAKLERQLRQAAKLEAVGRLAGGIAHDFNNLLTVINGCAELLTDEASPVGGRLAELAVDIRRAGERAAALTGQLLTFSRKRDAKVSAVNLNEVLGDAVRLLERVLGENITIRTRLAPDLPPVRGEGGLLHQVVMNLAVNARDAMICGGTLTLSTERYFESVVGPAANNGGPTVVQRPYIRLTVQDTGTGMTDEVKARMFEPFFTTKEVGAGTGLGLATVYGIVQSLGGAIRVDSAVGRGTTFHIDLRLHGETLDVDLANATPSQPLRRPPGRALGGATILVVEDNSMVRDLLVSSLTAEGAMVLAAESPADALGRLSGYSSRVDIMVTDVVMPGMSGRALADIIHVDRPSTQVLFMSGYTADEVLREGVLADQVEFLQKPFTPDHLTSRLVDLLRQARERNLRDPDAD